MHRLTDRTARISDGGTHGFLEWLTAPSRRLRYSVGMTITEDMQDAILKVPVGSWTPAYDGDGQARDGAWVADITGMLDLSSWPGGMLRRRAPGPRRPPPAAAARRALALGRRDHCRGHPPAGPSVRLTSGNHPCDTERATTGARGTPPADATARQPAMARTRKSTPAEPLRPA